MTAGALAALTTVVQLGLLLLLAVIAGLAIREAHAAHARGIARVHRGRQFWTARPCCLDSRDGLVCNCPTPPIDLQETAR